MAIQKLALTKLVGTTWGCDFARARQIYMTVIRSTLAYGASSWHKLGDSAVGPARELAEIQNSCLRTICGAHKATPVRYLESEAAIPPLDLYLNSRVAAFEERIQRTGKANLLRSACARAALVLDKGIDQRRRRTIGSKPLPAGYTLEKAAKAKEWTDDHKDAKQALAWHWKCRWYNDAERQEIGRRAIAEEAQGPSCELKKGGRYYGLLRHEATVLCQVRTGKVGLNAFLFKIRTPGVNTPLCRCGEAPETAEHVILGCKDLEVERDQLRAAIAPLSLGSREDLARLTNTPLANQKLVRWLLKTQRLPHFRQFG